jgi:hypothetical protein
MSVQLVNSRGSLFSTTHGHWGVYLTVATLFGWKPAGTLPPPDLPEGEHWHGGYDSSDGQIVSEDEAKSLASVLHFAAVSPHIEDALTRAIAHLENSAEANGVKIIEVMRMYPADFSKEFQPLILFLREGSFSIR